MLGRLRSLFPALAVGLAASQQLAPPEKWRLSYPAPFQPRRRKSFGPGKSPALSGPHSEPRVHIRTQNIGHFWYERSEWDRLGFSDERVIPSAKEGAGNFPFRVGDVLEFLNGFGQVTKRYRVAA